MLVSVWSLIFPIDRNGLHVAFSVMLGTAIGELVMLNVGGGGWIGGGST